MAQFVKMFQVDLQKPTVPQQLRQIIGEGDANGAKIGAVVTDGGTSVNLGGSCVGKVVRADGTTVQLTGTISGNRAYVVLDQQSCAIEGPIQIAVCWVSSSNVTTLVVTYGTVVNTQTGNAVQPSTPIPDLTQLLAEISAMETATAAAQAAADSALGNFAGAFSSGTAYTAGQYVTYTDGKFYRFIANHTAGAWNTTHVEVVTVGGELNDYTLTNISPNFWDPSATVVGALQTSNGTVDTSQTLYVASDFMPVSKGQSVYYCLYSKSAGTVTYVTPSSGNGVCLVVYDSSKQFVASYPYTTLSNPLTISQDNAAYIRVGLAKAHFENTDRIYAIYKYAVTGSAFEAYHAPIYALQSNVQIPQLDATAGAKPVPLYTITNFSLGAATFDCLDVPGYNGHRYTLIMTKPTTAYAQVGIIAGGAWKGSELSVNSIGTFTATADGTFYMRKSSGDSQTISTIYIFDTTNNDDLMAFLYTHRLDAVNLTYNGSLQKAERNWYYGKKFTAFGDSITEQGKWFIPVRARCPFFTVVNAGVGGSSVAGTGTNAFWKDSRINTIPTDTDFITIMGGTNDSGAYRTIGEASRDNYDTTTFIGAYNVLLTKIFYKFKASGSGYYSNVDYSGVTRASTTKPIYIVLITCGFCGNTTYAGTGYARMESFADACLAVGKLWGLPVADIYHNAGINPDNYTQYLVDDVHPNDAGAYRIASQIIGTMLDNEPTQ